MRKLLVAKKRELNMLSENVWFVMFFQKELTCFLMLTQARKNRPRKFGPEEVKAGNSHDFPKCSNSLLEELNEDKEIFSS